MPCLRDKRPIRHHLGPIYTSVFHHYVIFLLLTHQCAGQSQVVTPSQPIVATLGDDITLPCHLEPAVDVTDKTLEWYRLDMNPRFVYVRRNGVDLETNKHPSYVGRTSLSINKLKDGDISLKLDKVKLSDEGTYRCFIPTLNRGSSVQLLVGATSSLIISLEKTDADEDVSGAVLQCDSKGWYPKPEVLWLDAEGNLLSVGPAETIRGPDGLYTVSTRVTVEKKHSKSFTCRVQQKNINQTRETTFYVSDDLFKCPSSFFALAVGLAVGLSLCILLLVFFMWRLKRSRTRGWRGKLRSAGAEQLIGEIQMNLLEQQILKNKVETTTQELEEGYLTRRTMSRFSGPSKEEKQREVETLKAKLETLESELKTRMDELQERR